MSNRLCEDEYFYALYNITLETYHHWPHVRLTESTLKAHQLRRLLQIWRSLMTSCTTAVPTLSGWHLRLRVDLRLSIAEARFHPVHLCVLDIQPLKVEAHFTFMGWMVAYIARQRVTICPLQTTRDMRLVVFLRGIMWQGPCAAVSMGS